MMVKHRMEQDERENFNLYAVVDNDCQQGDRNNDEEEAAAAMFGFVQNLRQVHLTRYGVDAVQQMYGLNTAPDEVLNLVHHRWNNLYNPANHCKLQNAIIEQLQINTAL
jgi:hypothetical protein